MDRGACRLQFMESQRVGHNLATKQQKGIFHYLSQFLNFRLWKLWMRITSLEYKYIHICSLNVKCVFINTYINQYKHSTESLISLYAWHVVGKEAKDVCCVVLYRWNKRNRRKLQLKCKKNIRIYTKQVWVIGYMKIHYIILPTFMCVWNFLKRESLQCKVIKSYQLSCSNLNEFYNLLFIRHFESSTTWTLFLISLAFLNCSKLWTEKNNESFQKGSMHQGSPQLRMGWR